MSRIVDKRSWGGPNAQRRAREAGLKRGLQYTEQGTEVSAGSEQKEVRKECHKTMRFGVEGDLRSFMRVEGEASGMEGKASDVKIMCTL